MSNIEYTPELIALAQLVYDDLFSNRKVRDKVPVNAALSRTRDAISTLEMPNTRPSDVLSYLESTEAIVRERQEYRVA